MTVLMTYHKLVERDSKHVDDCWKLSAVILLLVSIVCCMVGSLSMQKIVNSFDGHCVLDARLKFEDKTDIPTALSSNSTDLQVFTQEELEFLQNQTISNKYTDWGKQSSCDFAIFIPIFQCCFAIIFAVMFIICGKGGKADSHSFLPNPFRIVLPSLIFFLSMSIISIINLSNINQGLSVFCAGFSEELSMNINCGHAMNEFRINFGVIEPSVLYILTITFSWVLMACWITLTIIMIARIVLVVDFQLVRVTVKSCDVDSVSVGEGEKMEFKLKESDEDNGNPTDAPLKSTSEC